MKIIIYGVSSFAELMYFYLSNDDKYEVVAFCADEDFIYRDNLKELPIISFEKVETIYPPSQYKMIIAIGYSVMRNRKIIFNKVKEKGYSLINYIHPSVINNGLKFGENNIILANVVIEPFVEFGNNNIVWSMTLLGHNSVIGNHNYISAQCLIAGDVNIKDLSFIGNGVTMINGITIEDETYLVAGTNIRKSTKRFSMYMGNPAKFLKSHQSQGIKIK